MAGLALAACQTPSVGGDGGWPTELCHHLFFFDSDADLDLSDDGFADLKSSLDFIDGQVRNRNDFADAWEDGLTALRKDIGLRRDLAENLVTSEAYLAGHEALRRDLTSLETVGKTVCGEQFDLEAAP
jgi:hypothetical protein